MKLNKLSSVKKERLQKRLALVKLFIPHPDQLIFYLGKQSLTDFDTPTINRIRSESDLYTLNDVLYLSDAELKKKFRFNKTSLSKLKKYLTTQLTQHDFSKNVLLEIDKRKIRSLNKMGYKYNLNVTRIKKKSAKLLHQNNVKHLSDLLYYTNRQLGGLIGGEEASKITFFINNMYIG